MMRKILLGLTACALLIGSASAEICEGVTSVRTDITLTCNSGTLPAELNVVAGACVSEGDIIAQAVPEKVFATQEGTIARVLHDADELVTGDVLELSPLSHYTVYATVDEAYSSAANRKITIGETVYMRCQKNGTHMATGRVYSIDGEDYMVETTGGELYVGEAVYLYGTSEMKYANLVGTGTVVEAETEKYSSTGKIARMYVEEGDYVERGQLLYTVIDANDSEIVAPVSGIITSIENTANAMSESNATSVTMAPAGGIITSEVNTADTTSGSNVTSVTLAPYDQIGIEVSVDEMIASSLKIGDIVCFMYRMDPDEKDMYGVISEVSASAENDSYRVWIIPDTTPERLGLSVDVQLSA